MTMAELDATYKAWLGSLTVGEHVLFTVVICSITGWVLFRNNGRQS